MSDPIQSIQAFYGRWARLYDLLARSTPGIDALRDRAAESLELASGGTVVEMGCGTGANLPYLRERVGPTGRVVGVDLTPGMLAHARARIEREAWDNVHVVCGDATRAPLDGPVDAVLATFVVGMLDDPAGAIEGWCDLLEPGGRLALVDAARTESPYGAPLNAGLRALILVSTPGPRGRHPEPAYRVLDRRVSAAHDALARRAERVHREKRALGIVRLSSGRIP